MNRSKIPIEITSFLNNWGLFLSAREKILNNFKRKIFPITNLDKILAPEPTSYSTVFDAPKPRNTQTKKSRHKTQNISVKDSHRKKTRSSKTPAPTKSRNMGI